MKLNEKYLSGYEASKYEDGIYKTWEESGFFNPDNLPKINGEERTENFSIVLPPPNVTGNLHVGHADMLAIEDSIVRFQRMSGKRTLWLPGTDHASIATQTKVEKDLAKQKIKKNDLGREKFLEKVNEFAMESQKNIISQTKKMGSSLDWSRLSFTLDKERNLAVKTAFKKMFDDGLIYKDKKIINWDPKGQTVISDEEVLHIERRAFFYTFKYSPDFPISISTTRPETKVGDTAVAVHPEDKRYMDLIGKEFEINFCGSDIKIKIVADSHVDPEFGTGALGVTPAHSKADWEIAKRNNLETRQVINEYAKMQNCGDILEGKKVEEARLIVVEWLRKNSLMEKEEEIDQNISVAERSGAIIEPLPKVQWFIDVNKKIVLGENKLGIDKEKNISLKELMKFVVEDGQIEILPERFKKVYYHWIDNLHDWAISRQIWYGHQIPVWYKKRGLEGEEVFCGLEKPNNGEWIQDEDVLDTWFSAGLWTFSTLGWPEKTEDFKNFHPTDVLETGHDILFFWVARMVLMTTYLTKEIPFKTVYLHGLVRDKKNQKFSKSLGNGIDPLDMIEKYGTDALRMSLIVGVAPGQDVKFDEDKVRAYKKFTNKLWNISRFIYENTEGLNYESFETSSMESYQKEKISEMESLKTEIIKEYSEYKLYLVSEKLYHYVWHEFADNILEEVKNSVTSEVKNQNNQYLLLKVLENILKMLHPLMPFITEEIWKDFPKENKGLLMVEGWD